MAELLLSVYTILFPRVNGTRERIDATLDARSMADDNQGRQDTDIQTADVLTP